MPPNALAQETSPYLLQHADNPVDWRPWGPPALEAARASDKPILLSVGYAACHWCHVMAHESFENPEIAALMNELFVSIKVDREERPDIDAIYQHALALLGQHGGWPLTMFLTPEGRPFWGGTYFPPESRWGRPGFPEVLRAIAQFYRDNPQKVADSVRAIQDALESLFTPESGQPLPLDINDQAARGIARQFDMVYGGIGEAPKFPNPSVLALVWRGYKRTSDAALAEPVLLTLRKMCQGGIYDHLGGGFARYSTDRYWLAPHFEKMLYDNAQLIEQLLWAWRDTGDPLFRDRAAETADWVRREMIAEGGGFAATLDADSEGVEGKYYVWSAAEIDEALGPDAELFKRAYDVTEEGNWEHASILNRNHETGTFTEAEEGALARCRARLFEVRQDRVRPGWDDKVLADWNGLMIAALAESGATLGRPEDLEAARTAFGFVTETMWRDGRLCHSYRAGQSRHSATLDDYAAMARAALSLYEVTGEAPYLDWATKWLDVLDAHYWDDETGGYYFTADDAEGLILRTRAATDNATPAGNAVACDVLGRLFHLTGEDRYRARAEALIRAFAGEVRKNVFPHAALLNALEMLQHAVQIVIVGAADGADTAALREAAWRSANPNRLVLLRAPDAPLPAAHPGHGKTMVDGRATAYVCAGQTCSLPITDPAALAAAL